MSAAVLAPEGPTRVGPSGASSLRDQVAERIEQLSPAGDVYIGWVAALDASTCAARYRASGDEGWGFPGWSPALAGAAVGRAALARHLHLVGSGLPHPLETVRSWVREVSRSPSSPVAEWVAELVRSADRATLAATAATATRWIAGFVRVTGWPLPDRLSLVGEGNDGPFSLRWPKRWRPGRGSKIAVASTPDAVLGKMSPSGQFDLLVHRPASPSDIALADRAAFEATAGALACGIVAQHVMITTADTGERVRFPIDAALLERGTDLITEVARQRTLAQNDWDFGDATPSAACHHCAEKQRCGSGEQWLAGPGRWRGGLPVH